MNKLKYILLTVLVCMFFSSCDKELPLEHVFSIGEEINYEADWQLSLTDVIEESRCPLLAQCVWAGRVVCMFELSEPNGLKDTFSLSLGAQTDVPGDTILHNYYFQLLTVEPYPDTDFDIKKSEYRVKVFIENIQ